MTPRLAEAIIAFMLPDPLPNSTKARMLVHKCVSLALRQAGGVIGSTRRRASTCDIDSTYVLRRVSCKLDSHILSNCCISEAQTVSVLPCMTMESVDHLPLSYKAAVYDKPGDLSIKITEKTMPVPGPGEALVKLSVARTGTSQKDVSCLTALEHTQEYATQICPS